LHRLRRRISTDARQAGDSRKAPFSADRIDFNATIPMNASYGFSPLVTGLDGSLVHSFIEPVKSEAFP
jgi:hypothetical protein